MTVTSFSNFKIKGKTPKFIVVGAGISGATFAERLATECLTQKEREEGKCVLVIEKRNHIAGNCYDYPDDETNILISKYGPHLFHTNSEKVWEYVNRFSEWFPYKHEVFGKRGEKIFPMPINIETINILCEKNIKNEEELNEYIRSVSSSSEEEKEFDQGNEKYKNAEEYCLAKFGKELYEKTIKSYTFKQWGKYPDELDASVVQRIPLRPSFERGYFNDKYQALPKEGYTRFVENILSHPQIEVILDADYMKIKDEIFETFGKETIESIIFTGPVDVYFEHLGWPKLEYRSIKFEEQRIYSPLNENDADEKKPFFFQMNSVVNYPDEKEAPFTRITEYKHFYHPHRNILKNSTETIIHKETSCSQGEPYYPVPNAKNQELYLKYAEEASKEKSDGRKVIFCGRLASYKYYNMDQAILNSLEMFEKEFLLCKRSKFSIVVSRYKENIDWLENIIKNRGDDIGSIYIYNKNDTCQNDKDLYCENLVSKLNNLKTTRVYYEKLQNIGRESHTYLYHIVKNFDSIQSLSNKIIFCQGNPFDHIRDFDSLFVSEDDKSSPFYEIPKESKYNCYSFRLDEWNGEKIIKNEDDLCFGDWLKKNIFCKDDKDDILISKRLEDVFSGGEYKLRWGANFCIASRNIGTTRTKCYFEHLLSLLKHKSCETGHFFERAWYYIFKIYL